MYILNLVLGCWVGDEEDGSEYPTEWELIDPPFNRLVEIWSENYDSSDSMWSDIHPNCRPEHFELYKNLPENWKSL